MKNILTVFILFSSTIAFAGLDFVVMPVKLISKSGNKVIIELHGKRLKIDAKRIQSLNKQSDGTTVEAKLLPEEIEISQDIKKH